MRKYFDSVLSTSGRLLAGAKVRVLTYPAGVLASIYSDSAGTVPADNPITTDLWGRFQFYVADGRYSLNVQHSGTFLYQIDDVLISESGSATGAWTFSDVDPVSTQGTTGSVWFNRTNGTIWERQANGWTVQATVNTGTNNPNPNVVTTMTVIQGDNQSATVSTAVGLVPTVCVKDDGVAVGAGRPVTFTVASGGGVVIGGSAVTDSSGYASPQSWTLGAAAGTNTLQAYTANASVLTFTATAVAATRLPAALTVISGTGQSGTVSAALPAVFSLKVFDQFGSVLQNAQVDCIPPSGGSSVPTSALSDAQGIVNFVGTLSASPGTQTFTFRLAATPSVTQTITAIGNVGTVVTPPTVVTNGAWMPLEQWGTIGINTSGQVTTPGTGTVTSFQLTTAQPTNVYPFSIGLGFAKDDASGASSIVCDAEFYQVDVTRRWANGNIKHAVISGRANLPQNVARTITISRGTPATRTALTKSQLESAISSANQNKVQCGAIGTIDLADLITAGATPAYVRTWLSGPEVIECHYRKDVGGGTLLAVGFHVRYFADGRLWIRAVVDNGYLDNGSGATATNADQSYIPTVTIGGTVAYNNGGASLTHYKNTRWVAERWIGGDPQITPKHDTAYLMAAKLVPNYGWKQATAATLNGLVQTYAPNSVGEYYELQPAAGYQPSIGILPRHEAIYLANAADARAYRSVIASSLGYNAFPIHYPDNTTKVAPKPSSFATWSIYGPSQGGGDGASAGTRTWEVNHHCSAGYLAYILTGDRVHYDTMAAQSSLCYLMNDINTGNGTARVLLKQDRGMAWSLRTIGQFCGIAPTLDDPVAATSNSLLTDMQTLMASQCTFHLGNIATVPAPGQGLGVLYQYNYPSAYGGTGDGSFFMAAFVTQTFGHVSDLEPMADMTNWNSVRDFTYKLPVGALGPTGSNNYYYTRAGLYTARFGTPSSTENIATWYTNWGQVWTAMYGSPNAETSNTLIGGSAGDPANAASGYWGNLMPAIAHAVDHGMPGAQAAWNRLVSASNWATVRDSGFDDAPQFGVVPRNYSVRQPSWVTALPLFQWYQIPNTKLSDLDAQVFGSGPGQYPVPTGAAGPVSKITAYNGAALKRSGSHYILAAGGGHTDYSGNEVNSIQLNMELTDPNWGWKMLKGPTPDAYVVNATQYYLAEPDGKRRPAATHTYQAIHYLESVGKLAVFLLPGLGGGWPDGPHDQYYGPGSHYHSFSFDWATKDWDGAPGWIAPHPSVNVGDVTMNMVVKNPLTDEVYWNADGGPGYYRYSPATNSWTRIGNGVQWNYAGAGFDTKRGRIFAVGDYSATLNPQLFDASTGALVSVTYTGLGTAALKTSYNATVYDEVNDCFYIVDNVAGLLRLTRVSYVNDTTMNVDTPTITLASGVSWPPAKSGGVNNSVQYVPELKGIVIANNYSGNLYFMRTAL